MVAVPGMYGNIKLIAGTACPDLAAEIARYLSRKSWRRIRLSKCEVSIFPNENIYVQLGESVRGQDVYIIQTMGRPVNEKLMELLITMDAVRRDSAGRITAVIPHMSYARSDRKDKPRTPITARLVADMIQIAGADRFMTIDLHAGQVQGFFSIPGDVLTAFHMLSKYVEKKRIPDLVVAAADVGYAKEARNWALRLDCPLAIVEKRRMGSDTEAMTLVGDVQDRNVLIVDDEVDTGGTLLEAVRILKGNGARDIYVAFTHATFSPPFKERFDELKAEVKEFVFTNTLPVSKAFEADNMTVLSVAPLLGEVIRRAHLGLSVGVLFNE
jgi:ribose-phosphate pyrophosphokinase